MSLTIGIGMSLENNLIYPTSPDQKSKTAVCVLLEKDGLFLSVTRKNDHTDFGLPGGKLDFGETLIQCAKREVLEETGYELNVDPYNPFMKFDENGMFTITFKANFATNNPTKQSTSEKETGLVSFVNKEQLYSGSFGDYNKAMLNHFGH